jgi:hypothetical protein
MPASEAMKITGHTQMVTFQRYVNITDEAALRGAERRQSCDGIKVLALSGSRARLMRVKRATDLLLTKSSSVFSRDEESFHHLGLSEVTVEGAEFVQPRIVAIKVRIRRIVRIAPQITEVLHQDKRAVEFLLDQY